MVFSSISQITPFEFPHAFVSYLIVWLVSQVWCPHISSPCWALVPYHWVTLSLSTLVLTCLHEHENDSLGSPFLFLTSPSGADGKLPFPTTPQMFMPAGMGPLCSSHFAYFLGNLIYSHCLDHPLLHSDSRTHLRPL